MRTPPHTALRGTIVTEFAHLEALAASWDRLHRAGRRPEVFQTFGWIRAAWRAYARNGGVSLWSRSTTKRPWSACCHSP